MVPIRRFAVVMLLGLPGLAAQTNPGTRPQNDYIDSKICATCHREIAADYARTGQSFQRRWQLDAGGKQIDIERGMAPCADHERPQTTGGRILAMLQRFEGAIKLHPLRDLGIR